MKPERSPARTRIAALAIATSLATSLAAPAWAEQTEGFYIGGAIGPSLMATQATTLDLLMGAAPNVRVPSLKTGFDPGFALSAKAGYGIGNGIRYELEAEYSNNAQSHQSSGSESTYGLFANALFDIDLGDDIDWVTPYVGVGIGVQFAQWSSVVVAGAGGAAYGDPLNASVSGTTANFAYQIIAGLAFPVDQVTGLSVIAEYRFTSTVGTRAAAGTASSAVAGPLGAHVHAGGAQSNSVMVGLRYAFDAEAPDEDAMAGLPPAAPQRVAPSRTYIVYFDRGSASLTPRAQDVVATAARASNRVAFTRIEISGHTDPATDKAGSIELSKARSDAVADEMVRWGILRSSIDIHAFGDERVLKAATGTQEDPNRRVEIVYR